MVCLDVYIPEALINAIKRRGIDEGALIDMLIKLMDLDPGDAVKSHAELAVNAFNEGLKFIDKSDVIQASEKLYKAVEEAVKALAIANGLEEAKNALNSGRWTVNLLDRAARRLGDDVWRAWVEAYFLHVNGFHESRIDIDAVRARVGIIARVIDLVKQYVTH